MIEYSNKDKMVHEGSVVLFCCWELSKTTEIYPCISPVKKCYQKWSNRCTRQVRQVHWHLFAHCITGTAYLRRNLQIMHCFFVLFSQLYPTGCFENLWKWYLYWIDSYRWYFATSITKYIDIQHIVPSLNLTYFIIHSKVVPWSITHH